MSYKDKPEKTVIVSLRNDNQNEQRPSAPEPYLIQISGRATGQMFALKNRVLKIGRDSQCQVILDDPQVSRNHAEIVWIDGKPVLRDLGSTNGVCVNGTKVQEQELQNGDKVLIGTRMYFKFAYQDVIDQSYQQNIFKAANIDALTQLYNKKFFIDSLQREFSFSKRSGQALSLMMIDVDYFKKLNDTYGHLAGDQVLKVVGQHLLKNLRLENIACRYGGEEFAVILRNVTGDLALQIAERLRTSLEKEKIPYRNQTLGITVSIGIATYADGNLETAEDLVLKADENLYNAKENGRNRTVLKAA